MPDIRPGDAAALPFTPSTDQVRAAYVRAMRNAFIASAGEHEQEFDRWLATIWQQGAETALDHAIRNDDGITLRLEKPNPYASGRPMTTAEWLKATDEALKP